MRHIQHLIFTLTAVTTLTFAGCQQVFKPPQVTQAVEAPVIHTGATPQKPSNQFELQGKIGVKTPKQSGSAFYTWSQNQQDFNIQLNGILGIGKTIIEGKAGEVTLNSSKTGRITAQKNYSKKPQVGLHLLPILSVGYKPFLQQTMQQLPVTMLNEFHTWSKMIGRWILVTMSKRHCQIN